MHMEVEQEPRVILSKGSLNFSHLCTIMVDLGCTHNMLPVGFARKLGLPLVIIKTYFLLLVKKNLVLSTTAF